MSAIVRGLRNVYRSPLRSALMVGVLAVSIALSLIMLTVNGAFGNRLDQIRADVGTDVVIRPAGSFGFQGGGEPLQDSDLAKVEPLPHVVGVDRTVLARYTGDTLLSAIEPGTLGERFSGGSGEPPPGATGQPANFSIPITVTGTDSAGAIPVLGGGEARVVSGRALAEGDSDSDVAVVGQALADKNGLAVGSSIDLGAPVEVVGIFSSGQQFGDNAIFMPLETVRRLFDLPGEVSSATVQVDSVDNVAGVAEAIKSTLGSDKVDVVTSTDTFQRISGSLLDAQDSSRIGMIAGFAASAAVILFSIVLVVRQRLREIGVLKAIGAANRQVAAQFGLETLAVSVTAAIIAALITFPAAQRVANALVSEPAGPERGPRGFAIVVGPNAAGGLLGNVDVAVSPQVFLYALALAVGLAILASVVPAWYAARVKPAEVLRRE